MSRAELEAIHRRVKYGYATGIAPVDLKHGLKLASKDVKALLASHANMARFIEAILAPSVTVGLQSPKGGTDETTVEGTGRGVRGGR